VVVAAFQPKIVPGRSCGTCNLCCKLPEISEVESPRSVLCKHWTLKTRCSIYAGRPAVCRDFFCNWLLIETLGPEWQPERSVIHRHKFLILPDGDVDLGDFDEHDQIEIERRVSNGRIEVLARKKKASLAGEKINAFVVSA
jgi:hypothetical protein